jgi:hypothetical protein
MRRAVGKGVTLPLLHDRACGTVSIKIIRVEISILSCRHADLSPASKERINLADKWARTDWAFCLRQDLATSATVRSSISSRTFRGDATPTRGLEPSTAFATCPGKLFRSAAAAPLVPFSPADSPTTFHRAQISPPFLGFRCETPPEKGEISVRFRHLSERFEFLGVRFGLGRILVPQ